MKRLAVITSQCFRLKVADIFLSCPSVFRAASLCAVDGCMGRGYAVDTSWVFLLLFVQSVADLHDLLAQVCCITLQSWIHPNCSL